MKRQIHIAEICNALSLAWEGEDIEIQGLYLAGRATEYSSVVSYATDVQWVNKICKVEQVRCLVIREGDKSDVGDRSAMAWIFSEHPEQTFYDIHDYLIDHTDFYETSYVVSTIGDGCHIHPTAVIGEGVILGKNVRIGPFSVLLEGTRVGDNTVIESHVVIGEDGFQIIRLNGMTREIRHCGRVDIGSEVHIGSHTVIHRSLFEGATTIGRGSKLDTLIYVAHNCTIGEDAVVTSGVMLCGSTSVETGAWVSPNASVLNKVTLGKNAMVGMGSVVTRDVGPNMLAYGVPAKEKK